MYNLRRKGAPGSIMELSPMCKEIKKNLNKSWIFNRIKGVMTSGQEKETIKNRKLMKTYLNEGIMFQPQQVEELGSFGHVVLA